MNRETLGHRLETIRASRRFEAPLLEAFARYVEEAPDEDLFRVNPFAWAQRQGIPVPQAIDLFVHAARAGIFDFAFGVVCSHCGGFLGAGKGLHGLAAEHVCAACERPAEGALDDGVEVSFTVSQAVRPIRFHGDWSSRPAEPGPPSAEAVADLVRVYVSSAAPAEFVGRVFGNATKVLGRLPRGQARVFRFEVDTARAGDWRLLVPGASAAVKIQPDPSGGRAATVEIEEGRAFPAVVPLRPGPVELSVVQRTDVPEVLAGVLFFDYEREAEEARAHPPAPPGPFLTGHRLLSTQSFRELFRTETLGPDDALQIRSLAMLFTDLKASTALYERVGDLAALALVRRHFDLLREVVARHEGAVVKTIGDAVMATFVDPARATAAALEMHRSMRELPPGELQLKIGVHVGPCVAVDSNERVDYFGQTVNIAARVQNLAEGNELVLTDEVVRSPGVVDLLRAAQVVPALEQAQLKGIAAPVKVHRAAVVP